jgi:penicillin-binding protein 2B
MKKDRNKNIFKNITQGIKNNQQPKQHKVRRSHIPLRLNILFFIIFALFVALIVRLGYMQIVDKKFYDAKIDASTKKIVKTPTARGQIYDAKGVPLVTNVADPAITYTRGEGVTANEMREIAIKLVNFVPNIGTGEPTTRDKQDFWLANPENLKKATARLLDKEKYDAAGNNLPTSQVYKTTVDKVEEGEYNALSEQDLKAVYVFKQMNNASTFSTVVISSDNITDQDIAVVGEHEAELTGVATSTDWTREYRSDITIDSIIGRVSSEKAGLPAEDAEEYLKKGYSPNDRVGTSYLEKEYEENLQGKKQESEIVINNSGKIIRQEVLKSGSKGDNLKLTIDLEFQKKVEDIVKKYYNPLVASGVASYSDGVYVVAMNPNTGGILAMVGLKHDTETGEIFDNTIGTFQYAFEPGSVVKGATLTAGYESGAIVGNDVLIDSPVKLKGTAAKSSFFNRSSSIPITAEKALEWSSNAYMMKLTLRMLGVEYTPEMSLPTDNIAKVYGELRTAYAQYGMGVKTGIDLPGEVSGIISPDLNAGKLLDLSFGQYDTYTAMQLAQYAATVATSGNRPKTHVVEGIYDNDDNNGGIGKKVQDIEPQVLDKIPITDEQMQIIRTGFYNVVHGHDAYTTAPMLASTKMPISAKTGTAESETNGVITVNSNIVAYGPSDNPEIALGVLMPHLTNEESKANQFIAKDIMDAYYDAYMNK